ncbi:hypothetical protein [Mycolicibacterium tusciae]|uniref:hypothetical protein n=1 Tax=Mycolicibacterium tusciae TaxID=75922 RepID=UPI00024A5090|nr:hypothetical protein [Mycolicibacterium tusciae]
MLKLRELRSAFPENDTDDGFFNDPGPISTDAGLSQPAGYVLSTRISTGTTRIGDYVEPVTREVFVEDCSAVSVGALTAPRVETHIGFLVGAAVVDHDKASLPADYIASAFPVLRLVAGWGDSESESVAIAVGAPSIRRNVLRDSLATLNRNGRVVAAGEGASMRQSPCGGIVAVARMLIASESALRHGHIVLTGSMHSSVAAQPGDHFRTDVLGLGSVCIRCVE